MSVVEIDAVVVGAGIAGLAAARELQHAGCEVLVIDPSDRPGGVLRTDHAGGYIYESGPNTTLVKAPMLRFLERFQLADRMLAAKPAAKLRFLYRDGEMQRLPASALGFASTPLLSTRAKLRLLTEPFRRRGKPDRESVAEFVDRRLGPEVTRQLIGPFLTGVYAGDERALGVSAVFPQLVEHERRRGSLLLGALGGGGGGKAARGLKGSHATQQGFGPFARQLAEGLLEPPALGSRVERISRDGARWRVDVTSPSGDLALSSRRVVMAAPAYDAAGVLRSVDGEMAAALEGIAYAPIVAAPVGVQPRHARHPIEGFGFLVPREENLGLLGCLFMSELFPGRAPEGHALLHCMMGGVRWPEAVHLPDDSVIGRLSQDLEKTLGLREVPPPLTLVRWQRAVPQPGRDHAERMQWVQGRLDHAPGLALAGSYVAGVSVSDALASGVDAAARVLESAAEPTAS